MKTGGCYQKKKSNQEPDEISSCQSEETIQRRNGTGLTGLGGWCGAGEEDRHQRI